MQWWNKLVWNGLNTKVVNSFFVSSIVPSHLKARATAQDPWNACGRQKRNAYPYDGQKELQISNGSQAGRKEQWNLYDGRHTGWSNWIRWDWLVSGVYNWGARMESRWWWGFCVKRTVTLSQCHNHRHHCSLSLKKLFRYRKIICVQHLVLDLLFNLSTLGHTDVGRSETEPQTIKLWLQLFSYTIPH